MTDSKQLHDTIEPEDTADNNTDRVKSMMAPYRQRIDELDNALLDLLVERLSIVSQVGEFKHKNQIPIIIPERVNQVVDRAVARGESKGLNPQFVRDIYARIVDEGIATEQHIIGKK